MTPPLFNFLKRISLGSGELHEGTHVSIDTLFSFFGFWHIFFHTRLIFLAKNQKPVCVCVCVRERERKICAMWVGLVFSVLEAWPVTTTTTSRTLPPKVDDTQSSFIITDKISSPSLSRLIPHCYCCSCCCSCWVLGLFFYFFSLLTTNS